MLQRHDRATIGGMKRTPLNRGDSELKRTPLARGSSTLKPRSARTAKIYREERVPFVKMILEKEPICERCKRNPSVDVHEKLTRGRSGGVRGTAWLDPDNVAALCRECHTWVTDHPKEAEDEGWVIQSSS